MKLLLRILILAGIAGSLIASDYRGMVTFRGLPVPGATVTATQGNRKLTTTTDETGTYSFSNLPDGAWTIQVEMAGFAKLTRDVAVSAGAPASNWDLALLPLKTAAPAAMRTPVRTASPAVSQIRPSGGGGGAGGGGGDAFIMSGSLGSTSGSMTQADSFGNRIKNGTVQYNGNLAFNLDNSVWDAESYSLNGSQTPRPAFAKGRVNLSFGGPLKIPKLLNGKGGMFTLNYQMGRTRNGTTATVTVPTALERSGDFSQSVQRGPVTVYDPLSGQPFPGNVIPATRLDGAARGLLQYYPLPNMANSRLNYQTAIVSTSNQDNLNVRVNQEIRKKDEISGSIGYQRSNSRNPNVFAFVDQGTNSGINSKISWEHRFNKRLVNSLDYNFSRSRNELSPYFAQRENVAANLGIQGTSGLPLNWGPPNLAFTNFATLSDGNASLSRNQTSRVSEELDFKKGAHRFEFGGDYRRQQVNPLSDANGRGVFTFTGLTTSQAASGGYDFADFLLGRPDTASLRFGNADKYFRFWHVSGYAEDKWQLNKAITLNLGLRYDYGSPYTELYGRLANLSVAPGFAGITPVRAGQAGLPSTLVKPDFTQFAPSLGVAWRPFAKRLKSATIVRAGYGMSHPMDVYGSIANSLAGQPPFAKVLNVASSPANPLTMQTGFTATPVVANTYAIDPNYRPLSAQEWTAVVMQGLPRGMYVVAGYVGVIANHLDQELLPNSLPPGVAAPVNGPPAGYIYAQSTARFNASLGLLQVARQMASGFTANLSWTFAKAAEDGGVLGAYPIIAQNWQDLHAERARDGFIPRQQLNAGWQYSTGQGKAGGTMVKGWRGGLWKDWTFTNSLSWRCGMPLTATVGGDLATVTGTGFTGTVRADATGLPIAAPSGSGEPFNLAAFAAPLPGRWGDAGRNTITGPALFSLNGSIGRIFRLKEQRSVDLRFDATNFINHMTLTGWGTVVNSLSYGLPTGTNAMRSMTANLRFRF